MLNKDFYPTPKDLIEKMLQGINFHYISYILEPSAGKGDICDFIKKKQRYGSEILIDVIEIEPELQTILKSKDFNLIFDDFLLFDTNKIYDLIIANFPFSEGEQHLQKAISFLEKNGGNLVCLVNAETIKNPHTNLRKTVFKKLEKYHASIEYLENQFVNAERKTDVEVALIRLSIEKDNSDSLLLNGLKKANDEILENEEKQKNIIEKDFIKALIARFGFESKIGLKLIDEYFALKPHILDRISRTGEKDEYSSPIIKLNVDNASGSKASYVNNYLAGIRKKYWELFIRDPRFYNKYTSNILVELNRKLDALRDFDFNEFNIRSLIVEMNLKISRGIEDSILKLFDECSRKFSYYDEFGTNIHYYNGWKTNKAYKINDKIILPINGLSAWNKKLNWEINDRLRDMVKVFNYLAESEVEDVPKLVGSAIELANNTENFRAMDMRYFDVTFYKKGTCHIKFKNKKLLDKFNIFGSQRRGWLPPSYGKKKYSEMDNDERSTIDEFQGKEAYEKIMQSPESYILQSKQLLLT